MKFVIVCRRDKYPDVNLYNFVQHRIYTLSTRLIKLTDLRKVSGVPEAAAVSKVVSVHVTKA
jgi:hypothetical protein